MERSRRKPKRPPPQGWINGRSGLLLLRVLHKGEVPEPSKNVWLDDKPLRGDKVIPFAPTMGDNVTTTKDRPEIIRLENGLAYDAASNKQIDLSSTTGQEIREFAESYGQEQSVSWDSLTGQFRVDWNSGTLMPTNVAH